MTGAIPGERQPVALWWALAAAGTVGAILSAYLGLGALRAGPADAQGLTGPAAAASSSARPEPTAPASSAPASTVQPLTTRLVATQPPPSGPVAADCPPVFEIRFGPDSAAPDGDGIRQRAPELADWLVAHPDTLVVVDGYADASGDAGVNLQLSYQRATAVAGVLAEAVAGAGVPSERIQARGFGEYQPMLGEAADSGRNRRVTVAVPGYEDCPLVATLGGNP